MSGNGRGQVAPGVDRGGSGLSGCQITSPSRVQSDLAGWRPSHEPQRPPGVANPLKRRVLFGRARFSATPEWPLWLTGEGQRQ